VSDKGSLKVSAVKLTYASLFTKQNRPSLYSVEETSDRLQVMIHPILAQLEKAITNSDIRGKNVDMLEELERVCMILNGCLVTFCKSGKDRTSMAATLHQSRVLGELYQCGNSDKRVLRDANTMRAHGVRIIISEKNIGRPVFSFNRVQVQFLPVMYRPPLQVCESLLKKDYS
jgi:hypothetical protein